MLRRWQNEYLGQPTELGTCCNWACRGTDCAFVIDRVNMLAVVIEYMCAQWCLSLPQC